MRWNYYGNGVVTEEDGKRSFGVCINGKLAVNKLGENILIIDGETYEDLSPEMRVLFEDYNDYCCTTLLLEKILRAKVNFSEDRSAVYIETSEKIDKEKTEMYELDLSGYGKLIAKNKETGEKLIFKCGNDEKNLLAILIKKVVLVITHQIILKYVQRVAEQAGLMVFRMYLIL